MLTKLSRSDKPIISFEQMQKRLREESDDEQELIEQLIDAATARAEKRTGRVFVQTEFEWRLSGWSASFSIPVWPMREISEIGYVDADGAAQTLPEGSWQIVRTEEAAFVSLVEPFAYPVLGGDAWPVTVKFSAGYDEPGAEGDAAIVKANAIDVQMVAMLVAFWFAQRSTVSDRALADVPSGFEVLASERRIYR